MIENDPISISLDDIVEANQLSLHCPICAGAVENHVDQSALQPIVCTTCGTLYHQACWEQSGGKCAILGCNSTKYRSYGQPTGPLLKITHDDLPKDRPAPSLNGSQKRLKEEERRRLQEQRWAWLTDWFQRLLRAIRILE